MDLSSSVLIRGTVSASGEVTNTFSASRYGGPIPGQAVREGLLPIFGEIPHLTSISISDGTIVAYGLGKSTAKPEQGWCEVIAYWTSRTTFRTVIDVREAYGDQGPDFSLGLVASLRQNTGTRMDLTG